MQLAFPWVLLGLPLLVPYLLLRRRAWRVSSTAYAPLQQRKPPVGRRLLLAAQMTLEAVILAALLLALAGPHTESTVELIEEDGLDVALALDISSSMQAADFSPTRLEALKKIAAEFIRRSGANRVGVYLFAGDVFTQSPLTSDHAVLLDLVDGISFKMIDHAESGGTAIGDALLYSAGNLLKDRIKGRDQAIILVTDGENNKGADPVLAAHHVRSSDLRLYIIGLGGDELVKVFIDGEPFITSENKQLETKLDDTQLKTIAREGGGRYFRARGADVLSNIFGELARLETTPLRTAQARIRTYYTASVAAGAAGLFLLWLLAGMFLRRPWR